MTGPAPGTETAGRRPAPRRVTEIMTNALAITEVTTAEAFCALREQWDALLETDTRATVFQTWPYAFHAWKVFEDSVEPVVLAIRDGGGRLVGLAPFGRRNWRLGPIRVRVLQFAPAHFSDYCDVVLDPAVADDVLRVVADWIIDQVPRHDVIELRPVREDAWIATPAFLSHLGDAARVTDISVAPCMAIDPAWSDYQDALSKKRAKSMRYEVRNLHRHFEGTFRQAREGAELERSTAQFMDLHQTRMHEKNQAGHFADPRVREGFGALVQSLGREGLASMLTIATDDQAIAAACMFRFRGTVSYYLGGFDPAFGRLSPGKVLQAHAIDEAITAGAGEYDFLEGDEAYKYVWTKDTRRICSIEVTTQSWRRLVHRKWNRLRRRLARSERARALFLRLTGGGSR